MSYCIMRVEKRKRASLYGLQLEANRTAADHKQGREFAASDIQCDLTPFNFFLVKAENWNKTVTEAFKEAEVESIELYPRKNLSGQWIKTIHFKFPMYYNDNNEASCAVCFDMDGNFLPKKNTHESVVTLIRTNGNQIL